MSRSRSTIAGVAIALSTLLLSTLRAALAVAQTPVITQQGDPSVRADSIYRLAVNPADFPDENAAFLLDDGVVRYEADGTGTQTYRQIVQILRPQAVDSYRERQFSYAPKHERFTINWIRVVKPDGTVISEKPLQVQESDIPAQLGDPTYTDQKVIRVSLSGVEPGTIIDYSTTREELKPFLKGDFLSSWSISTGLAVKRSRYIVDLPATLHARIVEKNIKHPRTEQTINGRRILTWSASDLPKIRQEAFAADSNSVYQEVLIAAPTTWADVGAWYASNARDRYVMTPAVEVKFKEVLAGTKTLDDSLRAVHKWVAQDVRYVAIALGMGGYQPRPPAEVVTTGFGDCKDKATLFVTALQKMGLTAYPVLLNSGGGVARNLPSIGQFDHVIAAYKRPGAAQYSYADLTASSTPLGELPFSEEGEFGVLVHPDGKIEEITFPKSQIAANSSLTTLEGTLSEDGLFNGRFTEVASGVHQYALRAAFEHVLDSTARAQTANAIAGQFFEGADGDSLYGFNGLDLTAAPGLSVRVHRGKAATISGNTVILKNPLGSMTSMTAMAKELDAQPARLFDIDAEKVFGYQQTVLQFRLTLPAGWKVQLPASVSAVSPFGSYESTYAQNGREFTISRTTTGRTGIVSGSRVKELSAWMRAVGKDDATLIIIQKQ